MAMKVTKGCRYPGNFLTTSKSSGYGVYPSNTLGWEAMISVLLYSPICSVKAFLVAPLVAAITLSGVTAGGLARSISEALFLFLGRFEGPATEI